MKNMGSVYRSSSTAESPKSHGAGVMAPPSDHWKDEKLFVQVETQRRAINSAKSADKLFLSHCWRLASTQEKKRMIAAYLSTPSKDGGHGHVYWGDWLDLQSEGPVAWRSEIEQGIRDCSKFVALVDEAYLTSYNCLQEVAMAFRHNKPVVIIVLTQAAWDLLTVPGGAQKAKEETDKQAELDEEAAEGSNGTALQEITVAIPESPATPPQTSSTLMKSGSKRFSPLGTLSRTTSAASSVYHSIHDTDDAAEEEAGTGDAIIESMDSPLTPSLKIQSSPWLKWIPPSTGKSSPGDMELSAQAAWSTAQHGAALESYEDEEIIPGQPMSLGLVRHLFYRLSAINMCPCRELDESVKGTDGMLSMVGGYVEKDLEYHKDHATLRNLAQRWVSGGKKNDRLLQGKEAWSWSQWLAVARMSAMEPRPTRVQQELVDASLAYSHRRSFAMRLLVAALIVVLVAGVVASVALALKATEQESIAKNQATRAKAAAEESILKTKEVLAVSSLKLVGQEDYASLWELKTVYNVLSRLTDTRLPSVNSSTINAARGLLAKPVNVPTCTVHEDGQPVNALSLSPRGDLLASGSSDTVIRIYRLGPSNGSSENECLSDRPVQKLTGHSNDVTALEWSPSGAYIASGGSDQRVIVWPVNQEGRVDTENFQVLQHEHGVLSLTWSPSGRFLVSGTDWGNIHVWPVKGDGLIDTDAVLVLVDAHLDQVFAVAFSPSGDHFASGSIECKVWAVEWVDGGLEANLTQVLVDSHEGADLFVDDVGWSPDGSLFVMASQDVLSIRQVQDNGTVVPEANQAIVSENIYEGSSTFFSLAWAPDGDRLACGDLNGLLRIFRVSEEGTVDSGQPERILTGHSGAAGSLAWSPSGHQLYSSGKLFEGDSTVRLWEPSSTDLEKAMEGIQQVIVGKMDLEDNIQVETVAWSPAGNAMASGHSPGVRLYGLRLDGTIDPSTVQELQGNAQDNAYSVSFSPSGLHLAAAFYGRALRIWSLHRNGTVADHTGQLILADGDEESWFKVAWSPSGDRLACGTDQGIIYMWPVLGNGTVSAIEGRQKLRGHTAPVYSVAWAPSGAVLASGSSDNTVQLWQVRGDGSVNSEATQVLKGHSDLVLEVAWSPSSGLLASGSGDRTIRVWHVNATGLADVSDGAQVLYGHSDYVGTVRFSPAGDVLASGSDDTTIKLWTVHKNSTIGSISAETISGHTDWVRSLDWHPEGIKIASAGSYDHSVRVFGILSVEQLRSFLIDTFPTTNFTLSPQEVFLRNVPRQLQEMFPEHPLP